MALRKENFNSLVELSKEKGIEFLQIVSENTNATSTELTNGKITQSESYIDQTTGFICIYKGKRGFYKIDCYTKDQDQEIIDNLISSATYGIDYKKSYFNSKKENYAKVHAYHDEIKDIPFSDYTQLLQNEYSKYVLRRKQLKLDVMSMSLSTSCSESLLFNTEGAYYSIKRSNAYYSCSVTCKNDETGKIESAYDFIKSEQMFTEKQISKLTSKVVNNANSALLSKKVRSGSYKCILSGRVMSVILGEALSHMSGRSIYENVSLLKDKFDGSTVFSPKLNVKSDSRTHSYCTAVCNTDLDSIPNNKFIIKKGVLVDKILDREYADKLNVEPNKLSGATFRMINGKITLDEAIAKTKRGIYITELTGLNSSLDPNSLKFSCPFVGYLIKDGKLDHVIDNAQVASDCLQVLKDITAVLDDPDERYGMFSNSCIIRKLKIIN